MYFSGPVFIWLQHYGVFGLFFLLALGIVGLPVPDESLIIFSGILIAKHKLSIGLTFFLALAGSIVGITVSYILGITAGHYLLKKYGPKVGLSEKKINKTQQYFNKWGMWLLMFGYFIPGVRHLTGYLAGTLGIKYKYFALYAYIGALFWVTIFLSIGYFFGNQFNNLKIYIEPGLIALFVVLGLVIVFVLRKKR